MDRKKFQDWLAGVDNLSHAQRTEALAVLSGQPDSVLSLAAIEASVEEDRRCPHCGTPDAVSRGKARGASPLPVQGLQAHVQCRDPARPYQGSHRKERWLSFGMSLAEGETVRESARRLRTWRQYGLPLAAPFPGGRRPGIGRNSRALSKLTRLTCLRATRDRALWIARRASVAARPASAACRYEQVPGPGRRRSQRHNHQRGSSRRSTPRPCKRCSNRFWIPTSFLVSDGHGSYPPCAAAMGVRHEALKPFGRRAGQGCLPHSDGQ